MEERNLKKENVIFVDDQMFNVEECYDLCEVVHIEEEYGIRDNHINVIKKLVEQKREEK